MTLLASSDDHTPPLPSDFLDTLGALESNDEIISWINGVLDVGDDADGDLVALDKHVSRLIASFDVASEDVSLQLERLIDDISRSASRLPYDLHFMRDGALSLQTSLRDLTTRANSSFSSETSSALSKLHTLDIVKRNMEAARDVLKEAESWSTLESEVSSLLAEQSYEKAAEKLSEANKSMVVFQNTADYEHRRALMVSLQNQLEASLSSALSLQNQLEASLSSALIAAINSNDVAVCRNYYSIFDNIQRDSEFRTYYYGSRRSGLMSMWQDAYLVDTGEASPIASSPALPFSAFLSSFFTSFVVTLNTERVSIPAIFPDPQLTLSTFITSTLSSFQPTFAQRLSSLASHHGPTALTEIIASFKATENFAMTADKILERTGPANPLSPGLDGSFSPDAAPPQRTHSRRRSSRMSISRRMSIGGNLTLSKQLSGSGLDWDNELFEPFLEFQVEYGSLEKRFLTASLQSSSSAEPQSDPARSLREKSLDVFSLAEESLGRMLAFTHGYGVASLVHALDSLLNFQSYIDDSKKACSSSSSGRGQVPPSSSGEDLADLDYTLEDWSDIQAWLHLIEALRVVLDRLTMFEIKLRAVLLQVATTFRPMQQDPGLPYIPGTTRGEITLLAQSELNTMELQNILKDVETDSRPPSQDTTARQSIRITNPQEKPLFSASRASIVSFTTICQTSLQDAMLSPLRKHLSHYASSPLWSAPTDPKQKRSGTGASNQVQVPTFSLSPSEIIQHVAEGLLNLPRLFEVYQDDDVLSFSLDTLPFVDAQLLDSLAEQAAAEMHAQPMHARR
ncbi:oligomeric Golgi complex subunit 7 [Amylostereum chailletii]|nr:oligomeric Golgi complex subunit 7 [Amylostereum chailletii]